MVPPLEQTRRRFRTVQVRRVVPLTPHMVRITLTGEELIGFQTQAPSEHIKLLFPAPGRDMPVVPTFGPQGLIFPPDQERPAIRTYTPRRYDPATLELDVDFVLHGIGPGSTWAAQAQPGATVVVAGPGGGYRLDPAAHWYLLVGDETALPAIGTILEALPASVTAKVYVEVPDMAEARQLDSAAQPAVTWLPRVLEEGGAGRILEAAVRAGALPDGPGQVWVACEASAMRGIRKHLLYDRGLARTALYTRGYWKYGEVNHPDHDTGDDV